MSRNYRNYSKKLLFAFLTVIIAGMTVNSVQGVNFQVLPRFQNSAQSQNSGNQNKTSPGSTISQKIGQKFNSFVGGFRQVTPRQNFVPKTGATQNNSAQGYNQTSNQNDRTANQSKQTTVRNGFLPIGQMANLKAIQALRQTNRELVSQTTGQTISPQNRQNVLTAGRSVSQNISPVNRQGNPSVYSVGRRSGQKVPSAYPNYLSYPSASEQTVSDSGMNSNQMILGTSRDPMNQTQTVNGNNHYQSVDIHAGVNQSFMADSDAVPSGHRQEDRIYLAQKITDQRKISTDNRPEMNRKSEEVPAFLQELDRDKYQKKEVHKPHGTELLGIEPGVTTLKQVEASPIWSKAGHRETVDGFLILTYRIEDLPDMPFIQILLKENIVEGIVMHLKAPRELADTKLSFEDAIKNITPILIPDRDGGFREIYPEKGLAFVLEKGEDSSKPSSRVTQIIAEPVRASYLLIRAEKLLKSSPQQAYRDAGHAVLHEPENAAGNWLMAALEYEWGDYQKARQHAIQAVKSNNSIPQYCLTLVKILKELHETESAFKLLRQTVAACDSDPLLKVEAEFLLGDLYRDDSNPDYEKAIACHRRVLGIAEKYFESKDKEVRVLMKSLARKANISLATDFARQKNDDKDQAFQYLDAASVIADDLIKKEGKDKTEIWEVCLAAAEVGLDVPNLKELNAYLQTLKRLSTDFVHGNEKTALGLSTVKWRTGKALYNAMQIYETQKNFKLAVQYGVRAQEYLDESGLKNFTTEDRMLVGNAALHLGRIFQEDLDQKKESAQWYEKSASAYSECLGRVNSKEAAGIGLNLLRVSNGLWRLDQDEKAPKNVLTAIKFLEKAVEDGTVESSELIVPYTNLAMMYKKLDKIELAKKYALEAQKLKTEK